MSPLPRLVTVPPAMLVVSIEITLSGSLSASVSLARTSMVVPAVSSSLTVAASAVAMTGSLTAVIVMVAV